MATLQELLNQQAALDAQIRQAQADARESALAQIRALMADHGLTAADIGSAPAPARKSARAGTGASAGAGNGSKVAAKYRHPDTGASWSGRGLKPKWLSEELAKGRALHDFAV